MHSQSHHPEKSPSKACDTVPNHNTAHNSVIDHRWSEVVPPTAGLAFGAVWDPELGMVSFSAAELFEASDDDHPKPNIVDMPSDVNDNRSQILTIDQSTILQSEYTATLAAFRDAHPQYNARKTPDVNRRRIPGSTLPSSTFGGFDIYIRNPRIPNANSNRHYSCFDTLDKDLKFDPKTAFAEWEKLVLGGSNLENESVNDEGFFEGHRRTSGITEESAVIVELVLVSCFISYYHTRFLTAPSTEEFVILDNHDLNI